MKLATYVQAGEQCVGAVEGDTIAPICFGDEEACASSMLTVIERSRRSRIVINRHARVSLTHTRLLPPIPAPRRNIFCVGKNYGSHAREFEQSGFDTTPLEGSRDAPIIFTKTPESVIGDLEPIRLPTSVTRCLDYEAELAVIIGKPGYGISRDNAYDHVFGYSIINDITARDVQARHKQWILGKSLDRSSPMGPWIVTADEIGEKDLRIRCWVNDELRQDARRNQMIFDIPALIEVISSGTALQSGDIIATGTPAGVGAGLEPQRFLAPGDQVVIAISAIGKLTNPIIDAELEH